MILGHNLLGLSTNLQDVHIGRFTAEESAGSSKQKKMPFLPKSLPSSGYPPVVTAIPKPLCLLFFPGSESLSLSSKISSKLSMFAELPSRDLFGLATTQNLHPNHSFPSILLLPIILTLLSPKPFPSLCIPSCKILVHW